MKQNTGELSEADLKARRRFWNKKDFSKNPRGNSSNGIR